MRIRRLRNKRRRKMTNKKWMMKVRALITSISMAIITTRPQEDTWEVESLMTKYR